MPKKTVSEIEQELELLKSDLNDLKEENNRLRKEISRLLFNNKPWYTSFGIWMAIILTLIVIYLVYVFYMAETGHTVKLPEILDWQPLK